ncbi:MAG: hypothetical protein WEA24_09530 [Gemmatimonadota bacterium]
MGYLFVTALVAFWLTSISIKGAAPMPVWNVRLALALRVMGLVLLMNLLTATPRLWAQGECELCTTIDVGGCNYSICHEFFNGGFAYYIQPAEGEPLADDPESHAEGNSSAPGYCWEWHMDCEGPNFMEDLEDIQEASAAGEIHAILRLVQESRVEFDRERSLIQLIGCNELVVAQVVLPDHVGRGVGAEMDRIASDRQRLPMLPPLGFWWSPANFKPF